MTRDEARLFLHVELDDLEPGPAAPTLEQILARTGIHPRPCSACGQPARTSGVIWHAQLGPRWFDRCRVCFLETPPQIQVPLDQVLPHLRKVAAEIGAPLTVLSES
ncbi:hypothetical protein ACIRJO_17995 [Streptomyces sp. NPDC102394]|uniref:hypothetical protein n=1 Tax=Streptomyces sp. NPDC102394 TaxID=3366167 RepID=UPI00382F4335